MSAHSMIAHLAVLKAKAESGVDFRARTGALCPCCGHPAKIIRTFPWYGSARVRYHRCLTPGCLLESIKQTIKSVETDM